INGWGANPVALGCTGAPAGMTCTPNPNSVSVPGSSSIDITTTVGTIAPGTYLLDVNGSGTNANAVFKSHTRQLSITVRDFSLGATPPSQTAVPGASAGYTVTASTTSGFPWGIGLTCQVLTAPAGTSCGFDNTTVQMAGSATLTVNSSAGIPNG